MSSFGQSLLVARYDVPLKQLYSNLNNVFSRAILLETLLYEEPQMRPVFLEASKNHVFAELADKVSETFSNLISFTFVILLIFMNSLINLLNNEK